MTNAFANRPTTLRDYVAILRRRKWVILTLPVVAAAVAFVVSDRQAPLYQAQAKVLVNRTAGLSAGVTGTDPTVFDSVRYLATLANIARSPQLAAQVAARAKVPGATAGSVLGASSVGPEATSDVLDFSVIDLDPAHAVALVNAYAYQFTRYKTNLDTGRIGEALKVLRARMRSLERRGQTETSTYQTMFTQQSQLLTASKLSANTTSVLDPATTAWQISPHPKRNLVLAGMLAFMLALGLAFLAEALDRRIHSEDEVGAVLGLPILGRIGAPPRKLQHGNGLVMLAEPTSVRAETFRKLRTSIEFVNRDRRARSIMFTSGSQGEGKSTTVANLAVAFARAGRNVALVDLDVRRPSLHTFFDVRNDRGIGDVVTKRIALDHAIQHVALDPPAAPSLVGANGRGTASGRWAPADAIGDSGSNGRPAHQHFLHFLASGTLPPVDSEFLGDQRVAVVLSAISESFDIVLVDAPPFLAVGDAMALSANVDAIVVVTHAGTHRPMLRELARELRHSGARTLGFVLTGVASADGHGYGYGYGYGYAAEPHGVDEEPSVSEAHRDTGLTG